MLLIPNIPMINSKLWFLFLAIATTVGTSLIKSPEVITTRKHFVETLGPSYVPWNTRGGIASICFRFHFQETLRMHTQGCFSGNTEDAHPGVSGVSKDQKFCEKFKNTHCQVDHPAKME